ncbi:hypothetical protein [Megalodesulfovibrio paquesii]
MSIAIEIMETAFAVQRLQGWSSDPNLMRESRDIAERLVQLAKHVDALETTDRANKEAEEVTA